MDDDKRRNQKDFSRAKIYRITLDNSDLVYYGSTCQTLSQRMTGHRCNYKRWNKDKNSQSYCTSYVLFDLGTPIITLVEDSPCERGEQLYARERHFIENNNCVNKNVPGKTKSEMWSVWYEKNRDIVLVRKREHKINNKEAGQAYQVKYNEYAKTKTECACGAIFRIVGKVRHEKTSKHKDFITASSSPS